MPRRTTLDVPGTPGSPALPLAGLNVGTYLFKVQNPNSSPSNPLPFAVTAGMPVLTSSCLVPSTGCALPLVGGCCPGARQGSSTSLTIKLTGTNFATPDSNGNGSTVVVSADFSTNFPSPDPCNVITTSGTQFQPIVGTATVNSPTDITVQFDPRAAFIDPTYGTTYYVGVWNPGLTGVQKSDCGVVVNSVNAGTGLPKLPWFKLLP